MSDKKESDHRTDKLRNWDLWEANLHFKEERFKGKGDLFRVYQDGQLFEVWSKRDGLVTGLGTLDLAVDRAKEMTKAQGITLDK